MNRQPLNSEVGIFQVILRTFAHRSIGMVAALGLVCFLSALMVVFVSNAYLQKYIAYQQSIKQAQTLQTERTKLLIEEGTWAQYQRVEKIATNDLKMIYPQPKDLRIIS